TADARDDDRTANAALQLAALARLEGGQAHEAKRLLLDLPAGSVPLVLEGRVLTATGQAALGIERLIAGFNQQQDDFNAYHLGVGLVQAGGSERLLEMARSGQHPPAPLIAAARGAHDAHAYGLAGELAELAGGRVSGRELALAAFVAARAWARAGAGERSLLALRAAVRADPDYARAAAADTAFAGLHGPQFDAALRGVS
ncbi:MAG: hypothetical protein ABIM89_04500, partial [Mycobacteriales bacterium]